MVTLKILITSYPDDETKEVSTYLDDHKLVYEFTYDIVVENSVIESEVCATLATKGIVWDDVVVVVE